MHGKDAAYCYGGSGVVCLCVYLCVCHDREPYKTTEGVEIPFGGRLAWAKGTANRLGS